MRPIDADALINTLQELYDKREKEAKFTGNRGVTVTWNDAIYHIKTAPSLESLPSAEPEIVRCKDCKYYNPIGVCIEMSSAVCEDSFCCWAERRTDERSD